MTNFERIKEMSVEEYADEYYRQSDCLHCHYFTGEHCNGNCAVNFRQWLDTDVEVKRMTKVLCDRCGSAVDYFIAPDREYEFYIGKLVNNEMKYKKVDLCSQCYPTVWYTAFAGNYTHEGGPKGEDNDTD